MRKLVIADPRRFGTGELLLGTDALDGLLRGAPRPRAASTSASPPSTCAALTRGRRTPIKALLLDQRRIAGVGNIYADEALFRARIHPLREAGLLTASQHADLRDGLVEALLAGIDARGASIDDFRHLDGARGAFQDRFLIHRRAGERCVRCGGTIVKMVVAGRGTYVCEGCQPRPRRRRAPAPRSAARDPVTDRLLTA